ncbi:hypothetical protein D3C85_1874290 [compost metagenome]
MVNQVEDFIDFLKAKDAKSFPKSGREENKIAEEPKSLYGAQKVYLSSLKILTIH